jgi:hypothetical protein
MQRLLDWRQLSQHCSVLLPSGTVAVLSRLLNASRSNAALGWWWADPAAGYGLVFYAAREVREVFLPPD